MLQSRCGIGSTQIRADPRKSWVKFDIHYIGVFRPFMWDLYDIRNRRTRGERMDIIHGRHDSYVSCRAWLAMPLIDRNVWTTRVAYYRSGIHSFIMTP